MKKMGWTYLINLTRNRKIYFSKQNLDPCLHSVICLELAWLTALQRGPQRFLAVKYKIKNAYIVSGSEKGSQCKSAINVVINDHQGTSASIINQINSCLIISAFNFRHCYFLIY